VKRFKTRSLVLLVAGIAVSALVAGCTSAGTTDTAEPMSTDPVTITFSWWGNPTRAATTQKVIDNFHKKYPYITVEGQPSDIANYFTRLATQTAAGDAPDVMTLGGAYPLAYAARGALLDFSKVSSDLDSSTFPKSILSASTYKDKLYGVPTGANAVAVIANPAVFQAAGVTVPDDNKWTWDDFVDLANKITKGSPAGTFGAEERVADLIGSYAAQRDNALYDQDGKLSVTTATLEAYWSMESKLLQGGGMPSASKTQEIIQAGPEQTLMGQGKSGMIFAYTNQLSAYEKASGKDLVLLRLPGETQYKRPGMTLLPSQYYSIYSKSKFPRQAALFVDYLVNSPEAGQLILTDRGLPSSPKVREAITPLLAPADQESATFVDRISKVDSPATPPAPASSSNQNTITYNIDSQVLFGKLTPSAAAAQWIQEMNPSMAASVQ
jgi:multiple sugar transport system substrate-binding protein